MMNEKLILLSVIAGWGGSIGLSAWLGMQRSLPVLGTLLGVLLGPLGVVATLMQHDRLHVRCRICGEKIPKGIHYCSHCHRELTQDLVETC